MREQREQLHQAEIVCLFGRLAARPQQPLLSPGQQLLKVQQIGWRSIISSSSALLNGWLTSTVVPSGLSERRSFIAAQIQPRRRRQIATEGKFGKGVQRQLIGRNRIVSAEHAAPEIAR